MIFEYRKSRFGFGNKLFLNNKKYSAFSKISSFIDDEGYMGPVSCGAVALTKTEALIKAFAESIERRAATIGSKSYFQDQAITYDLINNVLRGLEVELTRINSFPIIDTTGCSAHVDTNEAVFNAIRELLEKNAVLLFWYGKKAKKIKKVFKSVFFNNFYGYCNLRLYVQETFYPLLVVICIVEDSKSNLKYFFGIGSDFNLERAVEKACSEAYHLGLYYELLMANKNFKGETYDSFVLSLLNNNVVLEYIESFDELEQFNINESDISFNDTRQKIEFLVRHLPTWINSMQIIMLRQKIFEKLIVVKAYSKDLIPHVPKKDYLNLDVTICREVLNLSKQDFDKIPNCPIV
jgi:hypothetical protein